MTVGHDVLYLPDTALAELDLSAGDVTDAIEDALVAKANGKLHTAPKSAILPGGGRYMMSTLAVGDDGFIVVKQVSVCPANPSRDLPSINGAIMVLDANTGLLRAVLGANWVTAIRTAALSAVAARRLADPGSETVVFIGTGVQAHSHLNAFRELFPLKRVRGIGRGKANVDRLAVACRDLGLEFEPADTPEAALRDADLVVTSITLDYSVTPFLDARWLKPSAFAAITDLCIPWMQESMSAFGTVVVDDCDQEAEAEKPMLPPALIDGDLTDLVAGNHAKRENGKPSAFAFRGIALGDYATAVLAVRRAEAIGIGQKITR